MQQTINYCFAAITQHRQQKIYVTAATLVGTLLITTFKNRKEKRQPSIIIARDSSKKTSS